MSEIVQPIPAYYTPPPSESTSGRMWSALVDYKLVDKDPSQEKIFIGTITEVVSNGLWIIASSGLQSLDVGALVKNGLMSEEDAVRFSAGADALLDELVSEVMPQVKTPGELLRIMSAKPYRNMVVQWTNWPALHAQNRDPLVVLRENVRRKRKQIADQREHDPEHDK